MPMQPTYPGVYIEEIASGVRTITGVATSITAFIGRALRGPVDEPITINSFSDYERSFGGLSTDSTMSYAVRDFYLNGGSQAIIVRIATSDAAKSTVELPTTASPPETLNLFASSKGEWGNKLSVAVNYNTADPTAQVTSPPAPADPDKFNIIIFLNGVKAEEHLNVSLKETDIRFLPRVLEQFSSLLEAEKDGTGEWVVTASRPAETTDAISAADGDDGGEVTPTEYLGSENDKTGIYSLKKTDLFNLLCIPPPTRLGDTDSTVYQSALKLCNDKRALLLVDPPFAWGTSAATAASKAIAGLSTLGLSGTDARNAALYFPRVKQSDPNREGQVDVLFPVDWLQE